MELIYYWSEKYTPYSSSEAGFPLSGKFDISFDKNNKKLRIVENDNYTKDLWGTESGGAYISDMLVIVGDNGTGKTSLLRSISYSLADLLYGIDYERTHSLELLVFLSEHSEYSVKPIIYIAVNDLDISHWKGLVDEDLKAKYEVIVLPIPSQLECAELSDKRKTRTVPPLNLLIYNNVLNEMDYINRKTGYVNDFTLGGRIRDYHRHYVEMNYIDSCFSPVSNYL